jgi:hypothetical protein
VDCINAPIAHTILTENYHDEDFRKLLGISVFNDITWFNKEAFELTLAYTPLFLALENDTAFTDTNKMGKPKTAKSTKTAKTDAAWQKRIKVIAEIVEQFHKAEEKSEYRFDRLIEEIEKLSGYV